MFFLALHIRKRSQKDVVSIWFHIFEECPPNVRVNWPITKYLPITKHPYKERASLLYNLQNFMNVVNLAYDRTFECE
jgi:hypothetical protein